MANFFDKKQDVLELKMTAYGQAQYSRGNFNPASYSFYDTDIIYDARYAGENIDADQNAALDRIKDSIRTKVGNRMYEITTKKDTPCEAYQSGREVNFLKCPLGTSDRRKDKMPAWKIESLSVGGNLSSPSSYNYESPKSKQRTPTLTMSPNTTYVTYGTGSESEMEIDDEGFVTLRVIEENVISKARGNFEVEVFQTKIKMSKEVSLTQASDTFTVDADTATNLREGDALEGVGILDNTYVLSIVFTVSGATIRMSSPATLLPPETETITSTINMGIEDKLLSFLPRNLPSILDASVSEEALLSGAPEPTEDNVEYWLDIRVDQEIEELDAAGERIRFLGPEAEEVDLGDCD